MRLSKVARGSMWGKGMEERHEVERHEVENSGEARWSFGTNFMVVLPDKANRNIGGPVNSDFKINDWYSFNIGMTHTCVIILKVIYYLFEIQIWLYA